MRILLCATLEILQGQLDAKFLEKTIYFMLKMVQLCSKNAFKKQIYCAHYKWISFQKMQFLSISDMYVLLAIIHFRNDVHVVFLRLFFFANEKMLIFFVMEKSNIFVILCEIEIKYIFFMLILCVISSPVVFVIERFECYRIFEMVFDGRVCCLLLFLFHKWIF